MGKIHAALEGFELLPEGIGPGYFRIMTPRRALLSYRSSLEKAKSRGDRDLEEDLLYRIALMGRFPDYSFELGKLSRKNTHGDYFISQLICGDDRINAVIDWTTACIHPIAWEIIRSFVYGAPGCSDGRIDIKEFVRYVTEYMNFGTLNSYEIQTMAKLFYYQIAVSDYYNQYYNSTADNRDIYLHQAVFSTRLMQWFDKNVDALTEALQDYFMK